MPYKSFFTKCSYSVLCLHFFIVSLCAYMHQMYVFGSCFTSCCCFLCFECYIFYTLFMFSMLFPGLIVNSPVHIIPKTKNMLCLWGQFLFVWHLPALLFVSNNVSWSRQPLMHEIKLHSSLFLIEHTILLRKSHVVGQLVAYAAVSLAKEETKLFENLNQLNKLVCKMIHCCEALKTLHAGWTKWCKCSVNTTQMCIRHLLAFTNLLWMFLWKCNLLNVILNTIKYVSACYAGFDFLGKLETTTNLLCHSTFLFIKINKNWAYIIKLTRNQLKSYIN